MGSDEVGILLVLFAHPSDSDEIEPTIRIACASTRLASTLSD